MKLSELLEHITMIGVKGDTAMEIGGLAYDSRQVKPGWLFVAIPGEKFDGSEYIADAVSRGAVAVVSETPVSLGSRVAHIQVPRARRALAEIAGAYFGDLSHQMTIVGITGTNGKTTTAYMIRDILRDGGFLPGLLGTVAYEVGTRTIPASRTTPEAPDIHAMFQMMKEAGCDAAVMEVSSHAIALQRVHGIDFNISVFTNLTQDHLDFHKDMDTYFNVKAEFFQMLEKRHERSAVINIDDPWGRKMLTERMLPANVVTYGFNVDAVVCASNIAMDVHGSRFDVSTPWGDRRFSLNLLGRFNIHNALAAIAAGGLCGISLECMAMSLERLASIPGRLERIPNRKGKQVFVDYAHTDDALKNVLKTLREICKGKLVVVFGCGGNRDRTKRPKMGRAASELADYSIVTSDNPRGENPGEIVADIIEGFEGRGHFEVVLDRRDAIEKGIHKIGRKDILLVAGKGHETYQEIKGTVIPFDDREIIREMIR